MRRKETCFREKINNHKANLDFQRKYCDKIFPLYKLLLTCSTMKCMTQGDTHVTPPPSSLLPASLPPPPQPHNKYHLEAICSQLWC